MATRAEQGKAEREAEVIALLEDIIGEDILKEAMEARLKQTQTSAAQSLAQYLDAQDRYAEAPEEMELAYGEHKDEKVLQKERDEQIATLIANRDDEIGRLDATASPKSADAITRRYATQIEQTKKQRLECICFSCNKGRGLIELKRHKALIERQKVRVKTKE